MALPFGAGAMASRLLPVGRSKGAPPLTDGLPFAIGVGGDGSWNYPGASIDFDFANDRYYSSALGAASGFAAAVTAGIASFSRASVADWVNSAGSGLATQAANNVLRRDARGALREASLTNLILNAGAPATQSVTLGAGSYTLQVFGSGSCALSGGPTGTASNNGAVVFTLGSSTTVTFTVSGSLFAFGCWQVSTAAVLRSSPIITAGTSAARAIETLAAIGAISYPFTVALVAREGAAGVSSASLLTYGVSSVEGLQIRRNNAISGIGVVKTVGGSGVAVALATSSPLGGRFAFAAAIDQGDQAVSLNGSAVVTATDAAMPTGSLANPSIGGANSGSFTVGNDWNEFIERVVIVPGRKLNSELQVLSTLAAWGG